MAYRQRKAGQTAQRTGGSLVQSNTVAPPTPEQALAKTKYEQVALLWASADGYEKSFFSGGSFSQILENKLKGDPKAIAINNWLDHLWLDYYNRKDVINSRGTVDEVVAIEISFINHGNPPYPIRDLLTNNPLSPPA